MAVLLMWEAYPPAILAAVALHAALLYIIIDKVVLADNYVDLDTPIYIPVMMVDVNPQRLRKLENLELQRQSDQRLAQRRQEEAAAAERAQDARRAKDREAAEKAETVRQERELTERRNKEEQDRINAQEQARTRERELEQQRENERLAQERAAREAEEARQATALREAEAQRQAQAQREAEQATADNQNVSSYMAIIRDAIANNWSVPPSARNGMLVVLELKLVPTGEIIDSYIGLSSGDDAFDRSALQAVGRVQRFPELQDMSNRVFETNFRTLTIRFRPEDLLR